MSKEIEKSSKKRSFISGGLLIFLFFLINLTATMSTSLFPPYLDTLRNYFGYDKYSLIQLINVTFIVLTGISTVLCGYFADKRSRKVILEIGGFIIAIFSILIILTPEGKLGYPIFFIFYAFLGIGMGTGIPTMFSIIGDAVPADKRTKVMSYLTAATLLGGVLGGIIGNSIVDSNGDWRTGYFYIGIMGVFLLVAILFIDEPKRGSSEEELKEVLDGAEYRYQFTKEDFSTLRNNKSNIWLIINFIDTFPSGIILGFLYVYLKDSHNLKGDPVNNMTIILGISALLGIFTFGYLGDKLYKKNKKAKVMIALFCNGFPVIFFLIMLNLSFTVSDTFQLGDALGQPKVLLYLICFCLIMFINQGVGPNWYSTLLDVNLPEHRATMVSMASAMDLIGRAIGPIIGALFIDYVSLMAGMYAAAVFWILNIFLWLPIFKHIEGDLENVHNVLEQRAKELEQNNS